MNKQTLVKEITSKIDGATQKDVGIVVNTAIDILKDTIISGEVVKLVGFGTFELAEHPARKGHNPKTGEEIEITASKTPKFKASKTFKDQVNA
jgi:DNA-binding protein HU-beta